MSASHFFVGLGAGIALLAVPVVTLTPGLELPQRFVAWIDSPGTDLARATTQDAATTRPLHGYQPGDPTPASAAAAPTVKPIASPTSVASAQQPAAAAVQSPTDLRWAGTGMIRSGGPPVSVRRVAGVDTQGDPLLPDGSPVLVSTGPPLQMGQQQWRAVRGLNGVVGWVPSTQLVVDGEASPPQPGLLTATEGNAGTLRPQTNAPAAAGTPAPALPAGALARGTVGNTDGTGVVLRNSPKASDRTRSGLMDGTGVTVLEYSGTDWMRVRADNGQTGWVPAQYVVASG